MVVLISDVTLADFDVNPDRTNADVPANGMKFEATMHCAIRAHIGEKSFLTIAVDYGTGVIPV